MRNRCVHHRQQKWSSADCCLCCTACTGGHYGDIFCKKLKINAHAFQKFLNTCEYFGKPWFSLLPSFGLQSADTARILQFNISSSIYKKIPWPYNKAFLKKDFSLICDDLQLTNTLHATFLALIHINASFWQLHLCCIHWLEEELLLGPYSDETRYFGEARDGTVVQQNKFNLQGCVLEVTLCSSWQPLTVLTDVI